MGHRQLRLLRRAQTFMVLGFIASYIGSELIDGAVSGSVALGALAVIWVPFYQTLTQAEDMLAVVVTRWLERFPPTRVLFGIEAIDLLVTVAALVIVMIFPETALWVLIGYLVVVSPLPLFVDIAEELYLNDLGQFDESVVLRGNVLISTATAIAGSIMGRPLGVVLGALSVMVLLALSALMSLTALLLRHFSVRQFDPSSSAKKSTDQESDSAEEFSSAKRARKQLSFWQRARVWRAELLSGGYLSATAAGFCTLTLAVTGSYLGIWIARGAQQTEITIRMSVVMLLLGITAVAVPLVSGWFMKRWSDAKHSLAYWVLVVATAGFILAFIGALCSQHWGSDRMLVVPGFLVVTGGLMAFSFIASTARQAVLKTAQFRRVIGWVFTLSALGSFIGVWLGFMFQVVENPIPGLLLSGLICLALTAVARPRAAHIET